MSYGEYRAAIEQLGKSFEELKSEHDGGMTM